MLQSFTPALLVLASLTCSLRAQPAPHWTQSSNVVWTTPSKDAAGSMPLGNGQLGVSLWVEENGDLRFYICRTDSFSEVARILKVGAVRVTLDPNPFAAGAPFKQELVLRDGVCEITAGSDDKKITLRLFVDTGNPVIHITGQSASPVKVTAAADCWRTQRRAVPKDEQASAWTLSGAPFELFESADIFPANLPDSVLWYHRNEESPAFSSTLKVQSLESALDKTADPLLHRTFGGLLTGEGFKFVEPHAIQTPAPVTTFAIRIASPCAQTATAQEWIDQANKIAAENPDPEKSLQSTSAWWHAYWDRAHVVVTGGDTALDIPGQQHPLRIARDSAGQNKFPGTIARTSVYSRPLTPDEITRLAAAAHDQPNPIQDSLLVTGDGTPRDIPADSLSFKQGLTLEAWIKPSALRAGRIFDKLTAGGVDGFLLDIQGDTLRLIVGSTALSAPKALLTKDQWSHVAATVDAATGAMCVYCNGKSVVHHPGADTSSITRGYTLQRYTQACGGRGPYPIKFNGGMFTVEPKPFGQSFNPDYRRWGDPHWFQNLRHMYHPMLAGGDIDMTEPFFHLYESARPLAEARTQIYHNARGAYFPETMTVWGTYANHDYGWDRTGKQPRDVACKYWQYAWNQGPEIVALMLDRWDYTADESFLRDRLLPMAESILNYFDTRFAKSPDGKIILNPTQAVETYWFDVVNDMPSVAGLNDICTRLAALPENLTTPAQRQFFARLKAACPAVPIEEIQIDGKTLRKLAPAEKYNPKRSNCENPELYAIWPFRLFTVGKPGLDEARLAYTLRHNHLDKGWGYDGNCAALLGLADESARILRVKCANSHPAYRWPATWGPNFDWLPDQNHGGNLLQTTQLMLLQYEGSKIRLLPAWPKTWDVTFKLHAPQNTTVECTYRSGKIQSLKVTPPSRQADVILPLNASLP